MAKRPKTKLELSERDLHRWKLIEDFQARLAQAARACSVHPTWGDRQRLVGYADYLSLFLFALLNPAVRTMRAVCEMSRLQRIQEEVCRQPISLGSFSEAQAVLDPSLLEGVFKQLSSELIGPKGPSARRWLIQDGSLFNALPRMYWALWRRQGKAQAQVRLHLSLDLGQDTPVGAAIRAGKVCERAVWRQQCRRGEGYVGDRYYGESYQLMEELEQAGVAFVVRLRDEAVVEVQEELARSAADQEAKVIRQGWVRLGSKGYETKKRLRVVWVQTAKEVLQLVTNLSSEELSAGEVALLYKQRWQIELFFRWIKCILGCRHWLAESPRGVAIEIYLALIGALLLQLHTGQRPNKRMMELIQFYLLGVATLEELWVGIERQRARAALRKKS